jgi:hypothetical protein
MCQRGLASSSSSSRVRFAADRVGDVVGVGSEDVDGDAGNFSFAGVLGLLTEAFESLAVFGGEPFDCAHGRLLGR